MQVQLATKVSPETYQALDRYAKTSGRSKSSIIEAALATYLQGQEEENGKGVGPGSDATDRRKGQD